MRYATSGAFRAALERRLLTASQQTQIPVVRLRKLVVFDRLLARLLVAAPDRWLLKGALALDLRLGTSARTTKDMDLIRPDNVAAATEDFLAAQAIDLGDYFTFAIEKGGKPNVALEGVAVRYHVAAELAGRPFEDVIVDIGDSTIPFSPTRKFCPDQVSSTSPASNPSRCRLCRSLSTSPRRSTPIRVRIPGTAQAAVSRI